MSARVFLVWSQYDVRTDSIVRTIPSVIGDAAAGVVSRKSMDLNIPCPNQHEPTPSDTKYLTY